MRWVRTATTVSTAVTTALLASTLAVPSAHAATDVTGPDVSRWQHPYGAAIDWTKVRAAGHAFAIIKASGGTIPSDWIAQDTAGARAAGLVTGGYHYAQPSLPISTATDQARVLVRSLGELHTTGTLPPVLDLEDAGGLAPRDLVTWAQQFLETVRALTGRTPIVYTYRYFWDTAVGGSTAFSRYPLWQAAYTPTAPAPVGGSTAWSLWQYTSDGSVPGIRGGVDVSRYAGTPEQLATLADGTTPTSFPLVAPQAPVSLRAVPGNRAATVRWVPGDDGGRLPTSWRVTRFPGNVARTVTGSLTSTTFTDLTPGVAYRFTVRPNSPRGSSPTAGPSTAVVPGRTPAAPTGLGAVPSSSAVSLRWKVSAGNPTNWQVSRCSGTPCTGWHHVVTRTVSSWVDRTVLPGRTYAYVVRAGNAYGVSPPSAAVTVRTLPAPPAPTPSPSPTPTPTPMPAATPSG